MKLKTKNSILLISLALLMSGCASNRNFEKAESTSNSLGETAQAIHLANVQIDIVMRALDNLVDSSSKNAQPQYEKFDTTMDYRRSSEWTTELLLLPLRWEGFHS
jgi:uncharacterized protein YceK